MDLKPVPLGNIAEIIMGQSPAGNTCSNLPIGVPLLNGPTEFGSRFPIPVQYTNDPKKICNPDDILFCVRGSTTGRMNIANSTFAIGRGLAAIRHKNGKKFQPYLRGLIENHLSELLRDVTGSTFPNLNKDQILNFKVIELPLPLQHRIAEILGALDDKIELNRQMNQTLEQMAQALYKHYFVDGVDPENLPEGWKNGKLSDVLSLEYGKSLREPERHGGKYPVIGSSGIVGYHNVSLVKADGIVVGRKGNAGSVLWCSKDFFPIDTTFYVVNKLPDQRYHFLFHLLKSLKLEGYNSDSAVPGLNRNQAHNADILIPADQTIETFNSYLVGLFDLIEANTDEVNNLSVIRDSFLPKLISGELLPSDLQQIKKSS